jgi:exopolysaccharide production protein ExoQ
VPPSLALLVWLILLLALWQYDPAKDPNASPALWIPLIWMAILASRLPSQWLGYSTGLAVDAYQDGNPLDRTIYIILILLAAYTLVARSLKWSEVLSANLSLMLLLSFALLSVTWSDYPLVSLKRWLRDLGNYLMILVVLADRHPLENVRTLLRRLCYLLIPLSVILIKYFPHIGVGYSEWTGAVSYIGPTTGKNTLGFLCLMSGVFFFWDTVKRWPDRKQRRTKRILLVNLAFIAMTLWVLRLSDSATSRSCLVIGCLIIAAAERRSVQTSTLLKVILIPGALCLYLALEFGFNITDVLAEALGRDATLTDRTDLWQALRSANTSVLLGSGYESFWLGDRLLALWSHFGFKPNQAHNGYLEVYLNLGVIGLSFLVVFLIDSYRRIWSMFSSKPNFGSLSLAVWTIILLYNVTEAAFRSHVLWLMLLLGSIAVPAHPEDERRGTLGVPTALPNRVGRATRPK